MDFEVLQKYMDSHILRDEDRKFFKKMDGLAKAKVTELQAHEYVKNFFSPSLKKLPTKIWRPTTLASNAELDLLEEEKIDLQTQDRI